MHHFANPYWGLGSWDNIGYSMAIIYQILTVTAWQEYMYATQASAGFVYWVYFVGCTLVGGYFLLNLFVAVLNEKFDEANESSSDDDARSGSDDEDEAVQLTVAVLHTSEHSILADVFAEANPESVLSLKHKLWKNESFRSAFLLASDEQDWTSKSELSSGMANQMFCFGGQILTNVTLLAPAGVVGGDTLYMEKSPMRQKFKVIAQASAFNGFFMSCIFINTIVLALDHHDMNQGLYETLVRSAECSPYRRTVVPTSSPFAELPSLF